MSANETMRRHSASPPPPTPSLRRQPCSCTAPRLRSAPSHAQASHSRQRRSGNARCGPQSRSRSPQCQSRRSAARRAEPTRSHARGAGHTPRTARQMRCSPARSRSPRPAPPGQQQAPHLPSSRGPRWAGCSIAPESGSPPCQQSCAPRRQTGIAPRQAPQSPHRSRSASCRRRLGRRPAAQHSLPWSVATGTRSCRLSQHAGRGRHSASERGVPRRPHHCC